MASVFSDTAMTCSSFQEMVSKFSAQYPTGTGNFCDALIHFPQMKYSERKPNISALKTKVKRAFSLRNTCRRYRSVEVSEILMAIIHAFHCAVKLSLFN